MSRHSGGRGSVTRQSSPLTVEQVPEVLLELRLPLTIERDSDAPFEIARQMHAWGGENEDTLRTELCKEYPELN